jgi:hypothetical protein
MLYKPPLSRAILISHRKSSCVYLMLATVGIFTTALEICGSIFGAATSASSELFSSKHALYRPLTGYGPHCCSQTSPRLDIFKFDSFSLFVFFVPQFYVIGTNFLSKVDINFLLVLLLPCVLRNDLWVAVGLLVFVVFWVENLLKEWAWEIWFSQTPGFSWSFIICLVQESVCDNVLFSYIWQPMSCALSQTPQEYQVLLEGRLVIQGFFFF